MRKVGIVLALIPFSIQALAQPPSGVLLNSQAVLDRMVDRTMLWQDPDPSRPPAVIHVSPDQVLEFSYMGVVKSHRVTVYNDNQFCWNTDTGEHCRKFMQAGGRLFVVDPDTRAVLAIVTGATNDPSKHAFYTALGNEQTDGKEGSAAAHEDLPAPAKKTTYGISWQDAAILGLVGAALVYGMSGSRGGGGSNSGSLDDHTPDRRYYDTAPSASEPEPSYTAPIGGEGGLYGSAHGVGDN